MSRRPARVWSWLAIVAALAAVAAFDRGEGPATAALGHAWAALVGAVPGLDEDEDHDDDDDDDDEHEEADDDDDAPVMLVGGMPAVRLDDERQDLAGVKTARLEPGSLMPTIPAVGEVVDVQPLAALRGRYREEFFRAEAADVVLAAARREHERLDALYRDNADVARKAVLRAEADWQAARAERYRLWASLDSLRARARGEWGPVLAEWAFAADDGRFRALASGGGSLLRAVLPPGHVLPSGAAGASLVRNGSTVAASYVSPAPRTAAGAGESHFFLVSDLFLPAALRLSLRIPVAAEPATGLALPQAAVVRALGRAWAYVRVDESHFVRRAVSLDRILPDGRYLVNDLDREDEVATVGATILYAEEFRSQIRNEDDDD